MVRKSNTDSKDYASKEAETVSNFSDQMLMDIVPMNKESAIRYWNESQRQDASQEVKDHFKACMQRLKE